MLRQPQKELPSITFGATLRASTEYDQAHRAEFGYLNYVQGRVGCSAWAAGVVDINQWLQVAWGGQKRKVTSIATQGRADADQWVKEYVVKYILDGETWYLADNGRVFQGNADRTTVKLQPLQNPVLARSVRICPVTWSSHISMRCEVYYEEEEESSAKALQEKSC